MTQRDRDRLVALKKARKGLITQRQAAEETRPERAACSPAVEATEGQGRRGAGACSARAAVQPQAGREDQAEGAGDTGPRCLSRLRPDAGGGIPGQQTRHPCRTRDGADLDDRRQAVACQPAASREDPPVAAAPLASGRAGAVGHQRACLAGGSRAEALLDQHDRRRLQPPSRAVRAARLDAKRTCVCSGDTWSDMDGRSAITPTRPVCFKRRRRPRGTATRYRGTSAILCRRRRSDERSGRVGHRVDRGTLAAGQGAGGTQFPDGAGPSGERLAGGRGKDPGAGQRLSGRRSSSSGGTTRLPWFRPAATMLTGP